jgi:hypothetical protein
MTLRRVHLAFLNPVQIESEPSPVLRNYFLELKVMELVMARASSCPGLNYGYEPIPCQIYCIRDQRLEISNLPVFL